MRLAAMVLLALLALPAGVADSSRLVSCLAAKPRLRWALPPDLQEISGLVLTDDGRLLVHDDGRARIVELDYRTGREVKAFELGRPVRRGDFEGIAVAGPRLFLVTSDGVLYETREGKDRDAVPYTRTPTGAGRLCEVEGLAYEPGSQALLLLCKTARVRDLRHAITILRWSIDGHRWLDPDRITIPLDKPFRDTYGAEFRGSDLARDPVTGRYLAIAGINRMAMELTAEGRIVGAGFLGKHHPQAEGVAVARDGTILVSDEGRQGPAHLAVYACAR
jgi:uncharacterized protein YjiK